MTQPEEAFAGGERPQPEEADDQRERLARTPRCLRRAVAVARAPPDQRAPDASAVERERGNDVEQEQRRVDEAEPAEQRERGRRLEAAVGQRHIRDGPAAGEQGDRSEAQREQHQRDGGTGDRDLELLAGARRLAPHAREPAERPQVDPHDPDPQPACHQRVPELVQHERREVAERSGDGDRVSGRL